MIPIVTVQVGELFVTSRRIMCRPRLHLKAFGKKVLTRLKGR
jgi:hypothetical protein